MQSETPDTDVLGISEKFEVGPLLFWSTLTFPVLFEFDYVVTDYYADYRAHAAGPKMNILKTPPQISGCEVT